MKIIIDCREHDLYNKIENMEKDETIEITKESLHLGDILLKKNDREVLLIERKSVSDLIASIKDGRYKEQSFRLSNSISISPHNIVYIIEGSILNLPSATKKMVYGAITSIAFLKGFSVLRTWSVAETAELILNMARKIEKDWADFATSSTPQNFDFPPSVTTMAPTSTPPPSVDETIDGGSNTILTVTQPTAETLTTTPYIHAIKKVKKENITAENIGEIMLSQIPGVGSQPAIEIMKKYRNIAGLVNALREDPNCLENMQIECIGGKKRRINSTAVKKIREYLLGTSIS